jgi:hypothetical protein
MLVGSGGGGAVGVGFAGAAVGFAAGAVVAEGATVGLA